MEKIKIYNLKSKSKITNIIISNIPYVVVSAWIPFGSNSDPIKKQGAAHLLEHLYMSRNKDFNNEIEYLEYLEKNGITFNAYTTTELMVFYYIAPLESIEIATKTFLKTFYNPTYTNSDLKKQKKIVINESLVNYEDPSSYIWRLRNKSLFQDEFSKKDFYGTYSSINSITINDLKKICKNTFTNSSISFLIISPTEISENIINLFNKFNFEKDVSIKTNTPIFAIKDIEEGKKTTREHLTVSVQIPYPSIINTKEVIVGNLIRDYLGNFWSSVLTSELRTKKGLVYWVSTNTEYFSKYGLLSINFSCQKKDFLKIKKEIQENLYFLSKKLVDSSILRNFIKTYISKTQCGQNEALHNLYWFGSDIAFNAKPLTHEEYYRKLKNIKPNDVLEFSKKYLKKENIAWITIQS